MSFSCAIYKIVLYEKRGELSVFQSKKDVSEKTIIYCVLDDSCGSIALMVILFIVNINFVIFMCHIIIYILLFFIKKGGMLSAELSKRRFW